MTPTTIASLVASLADGIIKASVTAGMPEEEARARVSSALSRHAGVIDGTLDRSDAEAAAARDEADAVIAAGAPAAE